MHVFSGCKNAKFSAHNFTRSPKKIGSKFRKTALSHVSWIAPVTHAISSVTLHNSIIIKGVFYNILRFQALYSNFESNSILIRLNVMPWCTTACNDAIQCDATQRRGGPWNLSSSQFEDCVLNT